MSHFLLLPYPTPDITGGSVLSVSDRYHQGGPVQNPSRMFLYLAVFSRLTSRSGGHLPNNPSRDQLAHYNQSRTNVQGTHGDRNASKRDVSGRGSRGSTASGLVSAITDTGVELDLLDDLDDNDEGRYQTGDRRHNRGATRMFPALIPPDLAPDMSGGSVLNIGDRHHQGGHVRNPSRAFFRLVVFLRLTTSRTRRTLPEQRVPGPTGSVQPIRYACFAYSTGLPSERFGIHRDQCVRRGYDRFAP